ncbi:hypothetical protein CR513_49960, partial [Mucuna pruriens]
MSPLIEWREENLWRKPLRNEKNDNEERVFYVYAFPHKESEISLSGKSYWGSLGLVCALGMEMNKKDLVQVFLKQYKYNMDLVLDRTQLQNMTKKDGENLKKYTQR